MLAAASSLYPCPFSNSISQEEKAVWMTSILNLCCSQEGPRNSWKLLSADTSWRHVVSCLHRGQKLTTLRPTVIVALISPCLLTGLQASDLQPPHYLHVWIGGYTVGSLKTKRGFLEIKTLPGTPFHEVESCSQIQDIHHFFSGKTRWKGLNLWLPPPWK